MACHLAASAPGMAQQTGGASAQVEGRPVTQIRVVDEVGKNVDERIPPLPLVPGKPFDFAVERESLRKLYAMGDFSDIRVATTNEGNGVAVDFVVRRNYYNNLVHIEGLKEPPSEAAALAALRLNLGEPFRESSLREAVGRLEDTLHNDGSYLAKVTYSLHPREDTRQMDVTINIDAGPRARIGAIDITNQTTYSNQELIRRTKLTSKNEMTSARLTRSASTSR